ncbi:MAG: lysylphosphatidylglycerol synthase domain-containing protein [Saprospiraceae bacterium]
MNTLPLTYSTLQPFNYSTIQLFNPSTIHSFNPPPIQTFSNTIIKLIVLCLLAWAIWAQLLGKEDLEEIWATFLNKVEEGNLTFLFAAVLLMPVNWGLEALKWKKLMQHVLPVSFWKALKAILSGVTISFFTPNRVGDFGGRLLQVESKYNWDAVIATLVSSFSQLVALLTCGWIGLMYFAWMFLNLETYLLLGILILGLSLLVLMIFGFFNIDLIIPIAKRIKIIQRFKKPLRHLAVLKTFTSRELLRVLLLSFLRYLTFSIQFYLLLWFLGIEAPFLAALAGISTVFLVQTSIPLPPVLGLLTRGQVALFVWQFFGGNELSVLAATYSIFVINLLIPSLLGAVFIVQINVLKSLGYENDRP